MSEHSEKRSGSGLKSDEANGTASQSLWPSAPAALPDVSAQLWQQILGSIPLGVAILEASTGKALWLNATLQTMLRESLARYDVLGFHPPVFLPGLKEQEWSQVFAATLKPPHNAEKNEVRRLQFVHFATRHIGYWDWTLQVSEVPQYLVLTVQSVSESVIGERILATAGRSAELGRQRAEVLLRLNRIVSESLTIPDLLRAAVQEAAAYFESEHAAVLLRDDGSLRIGHSIGLADPVANAVFLQHPAETLTERVITERTTLTVADTNIEALRTPFLADGSHPASLISSPIRQGERTYGVVEVYFTERRIVSEESRLLLAAFADQVALALQKADLYQQIAEQRRQLQSIFDNAPVSIVYFDTDFRIVAINRHALERYVQPDTDPIGLRYNEILHDVAPDVFPGVLSGTPFHASHYVYRLINGVDSVCDTSLLPLRDERQKVVALLLLSFEVTELVQARQEADNARQDALNALAEVQATQTQMVQMEKMRAIGELASGVAHDLNNALMAILGHTELAEESLDEPDALQKSLKVIRKATLDASSTVRRLQNFARQRTIPHGEATDVNQVVQDVVEMTRPRWRDEAQRQGRQYDVQVELAAVPQVIAEASGLREVLINMIHNALNAMPEGGTLSLATRAVEDGQEVEIEVADTGIGMTPEVAARVFDPFFTTRGVEGTGLGLAVSWTIVQRHGGKIHIESQPGQGTHFLIRLPIGKISEGQLPAAMKPRPPLVSDGIRIFVVDDEPFVASVLTSILTRHGYRVTAASNAAEALRRLRETGADYQLVITDHGMPGMTGLELIAELRHNGPALPIILLTGWGESLLHNNVTEVLPDSVLGKPINQADLLDTIQRVLREYTAALPRTDTV